MGAMKYDFYINKDTDFLSDYKEGNALELAYSGEVEAPKRYDLHVLADEYPNSERIDKIVCEVLFERFNIDHPVDYHNRSMSVGDVVILDGNRAYTCAGFGFNPIAMPELPARPPVFFVPAELKPEDVPTFMDDVIAKVEKISSWKKRTEEEE
jgi:hypothetical protein